VIPLRGIVVDVLSFLLRLLLGVLLLGLVVSGHATLAMFVVFFIWMTDFFAMRAISIWGSLFFALPRRSLYQMGDQWVAVMSACAVTFVAMQLDGVLGLICSGLLAASVYSDRELGYYRSRFVDGLIRRRHLWVTVVVTIWLGMIGGGLLGLMFFVPLAIGGALGKIKGTSKKPSWFYYAGRA